MIDKAVTFLVILFGTTVAGLLFAGSIILVTKVFLNLNQKPKEQKITKKDGFEDEL